jgi:hypothetical protein
MCRCLQPAIDLDKLLVRHGLHERAKSEYVQERDYSASHADEFDSKRGPGGGSRR